MFLDEANLACRLQHPNIVHCYELFQEEQSLLTWPWSTCKPAAFAHLSAAQEWRQPLDYSLGGVDRARARPKRSVTRPRHLARRRGKAFGIVHRDVSPIICSSPTTVR